VKRLKGSVPRAFPDHRRREAKRYAEAVGALVERLGELPRSARTALKEYGRVAVMLDLLNEQHDHAIARRRLGDARRLRRELKVSRFLMIKLEQQIERQAGLQAPVDPMAALFAEEPET
jgi:hypothetical protein